MQAASTTIKLDNRSANAHPRSRRRPVCSSATPSRCNLHDSAPGWTGRLRPSPPLQSSTSPLRPEQRPERQRHHLCQNRPKQPLAGTPTPQPPLKPVPVAATPARARKSPAKARRPALSAPRMELSRASEACTTRRAATRIHGGAPGAVDVDEADVPAAVVTRSAMKTGRSSSASHASPGLGRVPRTSISRN